MATKPQSILQSANKSLYLRDYTFADLAKDIKAGKLKREIAKEIYNKNKAYFDTLPRLKDASGRPINIITTISTAVNDRVRKRPELQQLDNLNIKNFKQLQKTALKDIRNFIDKNAPAYKKVYASRKVGAVDSFKEKILDYVSKKYPKLVERSTGSSKYVITGQRLFTPYEILGRDVTRAGEYGLEKTLNKDIRKALGIPERPLKGEGISLDRMRRNYNADLAKNLKEAQKLGVIPKIDPVTKLPIKDVANLRLSLNQSFIPLSDIGVKPSLDNLKTEPLSLSVKYTLYDSEANDSGFLEIPYSPTKGIDCPKTA